ncbi:MAG: discoidin domain-containing protein, partial [Phycisphaerae bacterium]|nr:discoidin domain-containing protein [Phycisphaerae bacterium]
AESPVNNLEFKLIDQGGDNVWWVNRRSFTFPTTWQTMVNRARHFRFAWGPSGGKKLEAIGAIEFAVAAVEGGKGSVYIDNLTFEELPAPQPLKQDPVLTYSSQAADTTAATTLEEAGRIEWKSASDDATPAFTIDFGRVHEFGGVALDWGTDDFATDYTIAVTYDGQKWEEAATVAGATGGRDYVALPDAEGTGLRLTVTQTSRGQGVELKSARVLKPDFSDSPNAMYSTIAKEMPRGWYPRYFLGEMQPWTVVGVIGDDDEALIDAGGALEVDKASFRLEPFLYVDGSLVTWADVKARQSLADSYLPIPTVTWPVEDLKLDITAVAHGEPGSSEVTVRYRISNRGNHPHAGAFYLALRPFQVLPPWQDLNVVGGVTDIRTIERNGKDFVVNGEKTVRAWQPPAAFGAATFAQGDVVECLAKGVLPSATAAHDVAGGASGALRYDFDLLPGEQQVVVVTVPFHGTAVSSSAGTSGGGFTKLLDDAREGWKTALDRVGLALPPEAQDVANTWRSNVAYILINADGPRIQPGSRTYERSWIRDGALTSTALLYAGRLDRVREYIEWYSKFQYPNGKIPCIVDTRGPDPVDEHDSTGQYIYVLLKYYKFSRDRAFLEKHLPELIRGVDYLESLRNQRLTPEYTEGSPEKRACAGIVPESISHEGYCDKPRHSYWDSFFVVKGLRDATTIAHILERPELEKRFAKLTGDYRKSLYASILLSMKNNNVDYIPGCAELGDFDATSTAIGVCPCGESANMPQPALDNTIKRYMEFFRDRRDGKLEWDGYTPYELRIIGALVQLGQPAWANELLDYFMKDRRPAGWNHWAEVVYRDETAPRYIGDMPHTWCGSEFLRSFRVMFVYEREGDQSLVLGAGLRQSWLASDTGVAIKDWPTEYGKLSYSLHA